MIGKIDNDSNAVVYYVCLRIRVSSQWCLFLLHIFSRDAKSLLLLDFVKCCLLSYLGKARKHLSCLQHLGNETMLLKKLLKELLLIMKASLHSFPPNLHVPYIPPNLLLLHVSVCS